MTRAVEEHVAHRNENLRAGKWNPSEVQSWVDPEYT